MELLSSNASTDVEMIESQIALKHLLKLAIELSSEHDTDRLLEHILESAIDLSSAEGGTIYSVSGGDTLQFATLINHALNLHMGGTSTTDIPFAPIKIFLEDGEPNESALVALAAFEDIPSYFSNKATTADIANITPPAPNKLLPICCIAFTNPPALLCVKAN